MRTEGNNNNQAPLALAEVMSCHGICVLTVGDRKKCQSNSGNARMLLLLAFISFAVLNFIKAATECTIKWLSCSEKNKV